MYLSGKNLLTLNAFSFASKMDSSIGESDLFLSLSSSSSISGLQVSNLKPASERIFFLISDSEEDPEEILSKTFEEVEGYDEMVIVRNIRLESHCEHHMVPILGIAHIGYIPNNRVVGISKLARIVDVFGKRLQTQETMTAQIADAISNVLKPKGVAVVVDAAHQCMTTRGIHKSETSTVTSKMTGVFQKNTNTRNEFMSLIHSGNNQ